MNNGCERMVGEATGTSAEQILSLLKQAAALGIGRDRLLGVGKRIGACLWMHWSYRHLLPADDVEAAVASLPTGFAWTLIKLNKASGSVSFIHYPDFDEADEPVTGDAWVWRAERGGRLIRALADPWVLHHRWLTVSDDYRGFDVAAAIERSVAWKRAFGRDAALSSRIGRRSVWLTECANRHIPVAEREP